MGLEQSRRNPLVESSCSARQKGRKCAATRKLSRNTALQHIPPSHRLEHRNRQKRRQEIRRDRGDENRSPRSSVLEQKCGERRAENGAKAGAHVQKSVVGGCETGAERIGPRGREQGEDLAPSAENHAGQQNE